MFFQDSRFYTGLYLQLERKEPIPLIIQIPVNKGEIVDAEELLEFDRNSSDDHIILQGDIQQFNVE